MRWIVVGLLPDHALSFKRIGLGRLWTLLIEVKRHIALHL
jgi:hypothetical protein